MTNWLLVALAAQIIIASSGVLDRVILKKRAIDPVSYAFWFGVLGLFALVLLPFGVAAASGKIILVALFGGALFVISAYFEFVALAETEASETLTLVGAFSPVATLAMSSAFLGTSLGFFDFLGFSFLVLSGLALFFSDRKELSASALSAIVASSVLLAAYHVISKWVFTESNFVTGFFWLKIGGVIFALLWLLAPRLRQDLWQSAEHTASRSRAIYFANRLYGAVGSLMVAWAIALSNPAIVDATQNFRYVIVMVLAWLILHERFRGRALAGKIIAVFLIAIGLLWLAAGEYARNLPPPNADRPIRWGLTFSGKFSRSLGVDQRKNLEAILDELHPERIRLAAYWDEVEPEPGKFVFDDIDWQMNAVAARHVPTVLAVGLKLPRWPECHIPGWAKALPEEAREEALRAYMAKTVVRYREYPSLISWQVENEPFLSFGECGTRSAAALKKEVDLVASLDRKHPILVTDSGELGLWVRAAGYGDIFGTTMYRKVYPRFIGPVFGIIEYPLTPAYFRLKEKFVRYWDGIPQKPFLVSELQAEPWSPEPLVSTPVELQLETFSPAYFIDTIRYAEAAGFEEYYLWGAEWWYWMKTEKGVPDYWDIAKKVFQHG